MSSHPCRHCGSPLGHTVIDLGHQPPSNAYLQPEQLALPEITYPLQGVRVHKLLAGAATRPCGG